MVKYIERQSCVFNFVMLKFEDYLRYPRDLLNHLNLRVKRGLIVTLHL